MLNKETLDIVVDKTSELYRNNRTILNKKNYEIDKLEEKLKDYNLTVKEYKDLNLELDIKRKEYKQLEKVIEGVYETREIILSMYTDDMFDKKSN